MRLRCPSRRRLLDFVDGGLELEPRLSVQAHVGSCERCQRVLDHYLKLDERLLELPGPELQPADHERLKAGIAARREVAPPPPPPRIVPLDRPSPLPRLTAAAAVLVAGAGLGFWFNSTLQDDEMRSPTASPTEPVVADVEDSPTAPISPTEPTDPDALDFSQELERSRREVEQRQLEVCEWLCTLPPRGPLPRPLRGPFETEISARSFAATMESLLGHPDTVIGRNAARVLVESLEDHSLPLTSSSLVTELEKAVAIPDRSALAFMVLRRLDHPSLQPMVTRVIQRTVERVPEVRRSALFELALRYERDGEADLDRAMLRLLRSKAPADRALMAEVLDRMSVESERFLATLNTLYQEGAPRSMLALAAGRLGAAPLQAIAASLQQEGPLEVPDAIGLAAMSGRVELVDEITPHARSGRNVASALDALATIGGPEGHGALLELLAEGSTSRARRQLIHETLRRSLARADDVEAQVREMARRAPEACWRPLLTVCGELGTATSAQIALGLAADRELPASRRSEAGVLAAVRDPRLDVREVLRLLEDESLSSRLHPEAEEASRSPVVASLLVSLHVLDDMAGLQRGLDILGLELNSRRQMHLARAANAAAAELMSSRFQRELRRVRDIVAGG